MRYLQVLDPITAQRTTVWTTLIVRPRPLIFDNLTTQWFNIQDHPVNPNNGSLLIIPESRGGSQVSIHPITKAIVRTAGGSLSSEDNQLAEEYWQDRYKNYQEPDGSQPYQSVEDFKNFIVGVWVEFEKFYPDNTERENIASLLLNNNYLPTVNLIPSQTTDENGNIISITEKTGLDTGVLFTEKWFVKDFNELSQAQLETDRFPGIGSASASDIVTERSNNGRYVSPDDVANRVSGIGDTIKTELQSQVDEGSLTFNEI